MHYLADQAIMRLAPKLSGVQRRNAHPYDPATAPLHPPRGAWGLAHYGVMIPGLPEPFNFFDMITILGTAEKVRAFAAPSLVRTTPEDSAWLLIGSAVSRDNFRPFSIAEDCVVKGDAEELQIGDRLQIRRSGGDVSLHAEVPGLTADITLRGTDQISHFVHLPGLYDHWSRLCECEATFSTSIDSAASEEITWSGLATWEYARGRDNAPLPIYFFTYQILNISDRVQVLMTDLTGPAEFPLQRTVYVRDLDDKASVHTRGFVNEVSSYLADHRTPDGAVMRLPHTFNWSVLDEAGNPLIEIEGTTRDDFAYGMAAGYAGSYDYTGRYRGEAIGGRGYIEWIDRR